MQDQIFIWVPSPQAATRASQRCLKSDHYGRLTGTSVEAVVGAGNLEGGGALVDDPVLSAGAVAVPAVAELGENTIMTTIGVGSHLHRGAVGEVAAADIEALAGVPVGVDAVSAGGASSTSTDEVPGPVEDTGVSSGAVSTGPGEEVEESGGEVESAVTASGALCSASAAKYSTGAGNSPHRR